MNHLVDQFEADAPLEICSHFFGLNHLDQIFAEAVHASVDASRDSDEEGSQCKSFAVDHTQVLQNGGAELIAWPNILFRDDFSSDGIKVEVRVNAESGSPHSKLAISLVSASRVLCRERSC